MPTHSRRHQEVRSAAAAAEKREAPRDASESHRRPVCATERAGKPVSWRADRCPRRPNLGGSQGGAFRDRRCPASWPEGGKLVPFPPVRTKSASPTPAHRKPSGRPNQYAARYSDENNSTPSKARSPNEIQHGCLKNYSRVYCTASFCSPFAEACCSSLFADGPERRINLTELKEKKKEGWGDPDGKLLTGLWHSSPGIFAQNHWPLASFFSASSRTFFLTGRPNLQGA